MLDRGLFDQTMVLLGAVQVLGTAKLHERRSDVVLLSRGNGAAVMVVVDLADKAEEPGAAPLTSNATTATVHCPAAVRTHVDRRIVPQRLVTTGTEQADLCRNRQRGPVDGLLHKDHLLPS